MRYSGALQGVFAYFVAKGILTQDQSASMVVGAVGALCTLAWVLWVKHGQRVKIVTGLASHKGTTEAQMEETIAAGGAPSAMVQKTDSAQLTVFHPEYPSKSAKSSNSPDDH